jgi:hypothetical protein
MAVHASSGGVRGGGRVLRWSSMAQGDPIAQGEGEVVKTPVNFKKQWRRRQNRAHWNWKGG